ncbi:MAG: AAA family ATPase [Muribaculaceae bacterium]|nr:AAA family ATPase [Muribaculaceae bacterium]
MNNQDNNIIDLEINNTSKKPIKNTKTITIDRFKYIMPKGIISSKFVFDDIVMNFDHSRVNGDNYSSTFYADEPKSSIFSIHFTNVEECPTNNKKNNITIYIYRKGVQHHIIELTEIYDGYSNCIFFFLTNCIDKFTEGDYYLVVKNARFKSIKRNFDTTGNLSYMRFSILKNGANLKPLDISNIEITKKNSLQYTSGEIILKFTTNEYIDNGNEILALTLNNSFQEICRTAIKTSKTKCVEMTLNSKYIWTPGQYFIFLFLNNYQQAKIEFEISANSITAYQIKHINYNSDDFILAKLFIRQDLAWKHISKISGANEIKLNIVNKYRNVLINKIRKKKEIANIKYNSNFLISGDIKCNMVDMAKYAYALFGVDFTDISQKEARDLFDSNVIDIYQKINEVLYDFESKALIITNISSLFTGTGKDILNYIIEWLEKDQNWSLTFVGTKSEIKILKTISPKISTLFPEDNLLEFSSYSLQETVFSFQNVINSIPLKLSAEAQNVFVSTLAGRWNGMAPITWDIANIKRIVENCILPNMQKRILDKPVDNSNLEYIDTVEPDDFDLSFIQDSDDIYLKAMKDINVLVGLDAIKNIINATSLKVKLNRNRIGMGLKAQSSFNNNMIFMGNPGTGKTTVAGLIGRIYHSLGLLSKGDVIFAERKNIVGRFIGQTEENMMKLIEQAKGNVLFIDEAYSLCDTLSDRKDFGYRAIECLLTILAEKDADIIVILAGYEKEMKVLLSSNQGLEGRFPNIIKFEDYSADELLLIAERYLVKNEYIIDKCAKSALYNTIKAELDKKNDTFCNARWIENFIDNCIIPAMSLRLLNGNSVYSTSDYKNIIEADIIAGCKNTGLKRLEFSPKQYRAIGFRA